MIADFERRLADVLGTRLPVPFNGRVDVPPGNLGGNGPIILVGATHVDAVEPQLGSQRPEAVPGAADPRRVLRLACDVAAQVAPAANQGRGQQMQAVDTLMYTLDAPDFRSGHALAGPADPGFLIQSLRVVRADIALDPTGSNALPVTVALRAEGWFWPVGAPGQAGIAIGEIRIRGVTLPLTISPANPGLVAGGAATDLTVHVGAVGTFRSHVPPLPPLPFGSLALVLRGPGGPGKGTLVGSVDGVRTVTLTDNAATVTYQPPAAPAEDELIVALADGATGVGIEIARFRLPVRGA